MSTELTEKDIKRLAALINEAEINLAAARELLATLNNDGALPMREPEEIKGKVVEGIFDGQVMVDSEGKTYPVPANYASKSKLVEGDVMKLVIDEDGAFIYKQIGPVARKSVIGTLIQEDGSYFVQVSDKRYRVLLASVTFFRVKLGEQVSVIVPEDNRDAEWAAVEAAL